MHAIAMAAELKPCPFCGSKTATPYSVKSCHSVLCVACGGEGPEADSEEGAIAAWNLRASGAQASCEWREEGPDMPGTYATSCGELWAFTEGGTKENGMKFCHNCGKPVHAVERPAEPEDDDGVAPSDELVLTDAMKNRAIQVWARDGRESAERWHTYENATAALSDMVNVPGRTYRIVPAAGVPEAFGPGVTLSGEDAHFLAVRLRRLCAHLNYTLPKFADDDVSLINIAGTVIGALLTNLTHGVEEDQRG